MPRLALVLLLALVLSPAVARADDEAPDDSSTDTAAPADDESPGAPDATSSEETTEAITSDANLDAVKRNVEKRLHLIKVHKGFGTLSAVAMFTAQGFGLVNRIALAEGVSRDELAPTLMLHRAFVATSLVGYFGAGGIAIGMPGPAGDRASKALLGGPKVTRNVHIGLSIAHAIALAVAGTTGVLQAYVARDTKHWEPLVTTHQIAASTAAGLMLTAVFVVQ